MANYKVRGGDGWKPQIPEWKSLTALMKAGTTQWQRESHVMVGGGRGGSEMRLSEDEIARVENEWKTVPPKINLVHVEEKVVVWQTLEGGDSQPTFKLMLPSNLVWFTGLLPLLLLHLVAFFVVIFDEEEFDWEITYVGKSQPLEVGGVYQQDELWEMSAV